MDTNITGLSAGYDSQLDPAKSNRADVAKTENLQKDIADDNKKIHEVEKTAEDIKKADQEFFDENIEDLTKTLLGYGLGVSFATDSDTKSQVIKIFDKETDEIIKQYPSEDALALVRSIQNYLSQHSSVGTTKPELTGALFNEVI